MNYIVIIILIIIIFTFFFKNKETMISKKIKFNCNKLNNKYVCEEQNDISITILNINRLLNNSKEYANKLYLKLQDDYNKQNDDFNKVMNS